jgi:hypothetical protein
MTVLAKQPVQPGNFPLKSAIQPTLAVNQTAAPMNQPPLPAAQLLALLMLAAETEKLSATIQQVLAPDTAMAQEPAKPVPLLRETAPQPYRAANPAEPNATLQAIPPGREQLVLTTATPQQTLVPFLQPAPPNAPLQALIV